jgi:hypothetical protein
MKFLIQKIKKSLAGKNNKNNILEIKILFVGRNIL